VRDHRTQPSDEQRNRTWFFAALLIVAVLCVLRLRSDDGPTFERLLALAALLISLVLTLRVAISLVHRGR
jgi:hypothetical protein